VGNSSYTLSLIFRNHASGALIAESEISYVMISTDTQKSTRVPDDLRAKLELGAPNRQVNHAGIELS
jgi:acyl-CoA thioester hydrolase